MDLKELLYDGMEGQPVKTGSRLIAEPIMDDTYFARSVCLIVDCPSTGGHVGLILNKPVDYTLKDIFPDTGIEGSNIRIYCGGPVQLDRLTLLHTLGDAIGTSFEILPGLFVGGEIEKVTKFIKSGNSIDGRLRFFLGYSGWEENQLENEIKRNSWAVVNNTNTENILKGEGLDYWRKEIEQLGENYRSWLMVPPNPSFN